MPHCYIKKPKRQRPVVIPWPQSVFGSVGLWCLAPRFSRYVVTEI